MALRKACLSVGFLALVLAPRPAEAQTLEACRSPDPADWPAPAKPYFMLAVDTSGSMTTCLSGVGTPSICNNSETAGSAVCSDTNSCGQPNTRINGAKCALTQTVQTFAGAVNFGLASFAGTLSNCPGNCTPCPAGVRCDCMNADRGGTTEAGFVNFGDNGDTLGCVLTPLTGAVTGGVGAGFGCGNVPATCNAGAVFSSALGTGWRNGGSILVPLTDDPPPVGVDTNVDELLEWFDGDCAQDRELWALGTTPLEGILRSVQHYMSDGWDPRWGNNTYCASNPFGGGGDYPLYGAPDLAPSCRPLRVILVTDGEETCSGNGATAATALENLGINVHVIGFANSTMIATTNFNAIAAAGGTGAAILASNEAELSQALAQVISDAILPEVCDNVDNNCNGCIDEGNQVYCNKNQTARTLAQLQGNGAAGECCSYTNTTERDACQAEFVATGDTWFLPCWDPEIDGAPEDNWLCNDPGEICDDLDNNCETSILTPADDDPALDVALLDDNVIDEGLNALKCEYDDAHDGLECPIDEICDGADQNCDGIIDNDPGSPTVPYSIDPGGGAQCIETLCFPTAETCNGCDDDCDGEIDEEPISIACGRTDPPHCAGTQTCEQFPGSFPPGSCSSGTPAGSFSACNNTVLVEICNGLDDDCNGVVDDNPTDDGDPCAPPGYTVVGLQVGECSPGTEQCQDGALVCVGFTLPTAEICDTFDNDCDTFTDADDPDLVGVGNPCGNSRGICELGTTACVGGAVVCNDPDESVAEICDGLDNDCDGPADNSLTDVPPSLGCWPDPVTVGCATPCSYDNGLTLTTWCAPAGATCTGFGTLDPGASCQLGTLVCASASGWVCQGGVLPREEVCDGEDNDCDGDIDEGLDDGGACGSDVGECAAGILRCLEGALVCDGEVLPSEELCDGLDNDCNGIEDDGIGVGGTCDPEIDTALYPNADPNLGLCEPGRVVCTPEGDEACEGAVGPSPEVCDGIDNDCDGDVDETGPAPDGIDETADPFDPDRILGDPCGETEGACEPGQLGCVEGRVACVGGLGPQIELCDCLDNDCDGAIDEEAETNENPLCSNLGDVCVERSADQCQCLEPCSTAEFPCFGGLECVLRTLSAQDAEAAVCLGDDPCQGGCAALTLLDSQGATECGPLGTLAGSGTRPIPECTCRGDLGCHSPCIGVTCNEGERCVEVGPFTRQCRPQDNCFLFGCPGNTTCSEQGCVANPCQPNPCAADEVCRPSADFTDQECVASCAEVSCDVGQVCQVGSCVETGCAETCADGLVCRPDTSGMSCQDSLCQEPCSDGAYCDPATGDCGNDPCSGVVCPEAQYCQAGECWAIPGATAPPVGAGGSDADAGTPVASTGGVSGDGGAGGADGNAAGAPVDGTTTPTPTGAVVGLVTGGGGCSCRTAAPTPSPHGVLWALAALLGLLITRRRRTRTGAGPLPGWVPTPGKAERVSPSVPSSAHAAISSSRRARSKTLAAVSGLVASLLPGGCKTEAFCFDNCAATEPGTQNPGSMSDAGVDDPGGMFVPGGNTNPPGATTDPGGANGLDLGGPDGGPACNATAEICDGRDNDCDGLVDEADPNLTVNSTRVCGNCETDCVRLLRNTELDGIGCEPPEERGEPGTCSYEACAPGFYDLDGNAGNGCEYFCPHNPDGSVTQDLGGARCNIDDDCDGAVDEDVDLCSDVDNCGRCGRICASANGTAVCESSAAGDEECSVDNTACVLDECTLGFVDADGSAANGCEYACTPTGSEICDGLDNDCDGRIDNADDDLGGIGAECFGSSAGACSEPAFAGVQKCIAGQIACCDEGSSDVINANAVTSPATGLRNGVCEAATGDDSRILKPNDLLETCNNRDDDCDGVVDDAPTDTGGTCGIGLGICPSGVFICQNNALTCSVVDSPAAETCDGLDNDCDGVIDGTRPPSPAPCGNDGDCSATERCLPSTHPLDAGGSICVTRAGDEGAACNEPPAPPCVLNDVVVACSTSGAQPVEQPCSAGQTTCIGGALVCQGSVSAPQLTDLCGEDTNCDGAITLPDFASSESNCGGCATLATGSPVSQGAPCPDTGDDGNATYQCLASSCVEQDCAPGFIKCPGDAVCQACTPSAEVCDGVDNDCDCLIDEAGLSLPSVETACGVSPGQVDTLCQAGDGSGGILVFCDTDALPPAPACTFPAGVCPGGNCGAASELCDGIDNDCNGAIDEDFGIAVIPSGYLTQTCFSDDAAPVPGDGACRVEGEYVCTADGTATECDAVRNDGAASQELCDGIDNDCDGFVDEHFVDAGAGADDDNFVQPAVTLIGGVWVYRYEASRPNANANSPGFGNGYHLPGLTPPGTSPDETLACSTPGRLPWFNVSPAEVDQTCAAMGGRMCTLGEWQNFCEGPANNCLFANETADCSVQNSACNVHSYDFDPATTGIQDGLLTTGALGSSNCRIDWNAEPESLYDLTGNLWEITDNATSFTLMGGGYVSQAPSGFSCQSTFFSVADDFRLFDTGFRCCFDDDPTVGP